MHGDERGASPPKRSSGARVVGVHINPLLYKERAERRRGTATQRGRGGCSSGGEGLPCGHGRRTMCGHGPRLTTSQPRQGWSAGAPSGRAVRGGTGWQGATMASRRASQSGGAPGREEAAGPGAAGALGRQGADRRVACAPVARGLSDDGWALDVTKLERQRGARDRDARHAPRPWPSCMALRQWPWLCLPGGRAWIMGPKRHDRPARARSLSARAPLRGAGTAHSTPRRLTCQREGGAGMHGAKP